MSHLLCVSVSSSNLAASSPAVSEEDLACLSKHTRDATTLRFSYKFKSAEVRAIMVAAGYASGVAGKAFVWEYHYVQGRQLATAELMQSKWPDMWTQFCNSVFPGLLDFKATVDSWGTVNQLWPLCLQQLLSLTMLGLLLFLALLCFFTSQQLGLQITHSSGNKALPEIEPHLIELLL